MSDLNIKPKEEGGETTPPVPQEYKRKRQPYRFYKPAFLDENRMKMDVDRELESISQAMLQISEKFSMIDLNIDFDAGEIINDINNIKSQIEITIKRLGNLEEANSELSIALNNYYNEMSGSLKHLNRVITNAQKALSESSLQLDVATNKMEEQGVKTRARLNRTDTVVSDLTQAMAKTEEKLEAVYETVEKEVTAQIETIKTALAEAEKAFTEITERLEAKINDNSASIETVKQSVVTTNESVSKLETNVNAKFVTVENSLESTNGRVTTAEGNISTNKTAIADSNKALADYKIDVDSKFNDQEAFIRNYSSTMFDYNGNGYARWDVKAGVKYKDKEYFAGQSIVAEMSNGVPSTSIMFSADKLKIQNGTLPNGVPPFVVENNIVYLDSTRIKNGSIDNAKIGNVIQSNNYSPGSNGWKIDKNGSAEFQNANIRGTITATSGIMNNVTINDSCTIKGKLKVDQIEGDLMEVIPLAFNGTITIPAKPYNRMVTVTIVKVTGKDKSARISMNGNTFIDIRARDYSLPGVGWVYQPDFGSGSMRLPANTVGYVNYFNEGSTRFDVSALVYKS